MKDCYVQMVDVWVLNSFPIIVSVYVSVSWSPITSRDNFCFRNIQEMVYGGNPQCDPRTCPLVVLDLVPVMMFKIKLDREIHTFEKDEVPNVVANFEPCGILQISSGDVLIPSPSNGHSGLEIFSQCHGGEVQPNVMTRQVIPLNLSSFSSSTKRKFTMLVRSYLH